MTIFAAAAMSLGAGCGGPGDHDDHGHGEAAHETASATLSPQARANLGIDVRPATASSFSAYEALQAVVAMKPRQRQPVVAPVGGRVQVVETTIGAQVAAGDVLVRLVRDPMPRVQLTLTADLLAPASEDFHETAVGLRKAVAELEIATGELERLEALDDPGDNAPLFPRQRLIDLRYAQTRARKDVDNLRGRLRLHGLNEAEVDSLVAGRPVTLGNRRWKFSLIANGLWNKDCDQVLAALPDAGRELPWTYAGIGELYAAGLLNTGLAKWLAATPEAGQFFIEIAGLMQGGATLAAVRDLYEAGAFEPIVTLRAPSHAPDWDVQAVRVRPGERVEAGARLLDLLDQRQLYMQAYPAGREVSLLRQAAGEGAPVNARPLIAGSGPELQGLRVEHMQTEPDTGRLTAWLPATNQALHAANGFRTWALQPGTRYVLEVPVRQLEDVWTLPATALAEDGADYVVFVENGPSFDKRKVELLFRDAKRVVLGPRSDLFPGDAVVVEGAFALSLALQATSGQAVDPHAGHSH